MKIIKNLLALIGLAAVAVFLLNKAGVGHLTFYYGAEQLICTVVDSKGI